MPSLERRTAIQMTSKSIQSQNSCILFRTVVPCKADHGAVYDLLFTFAGVFRERIEYNAEADTLLFSTTGCKLKLPCTEEERNSEVIKLIVNLFVDT